MVKGLSEEATQTRLKAPARILRTECLPASKLCNPILAAVLDDADALTQRDTLVRPPLAGRLVGGPRYDQVVDVGEVFHDLVAIGIREVDAVGELHRCRPALRGIRTDVTHYSTVRSLSRYLRASQKSNFRRVQIAQKFADQILLHHLTQNFSDQIDDAFTANGSV